MVQTFCTDVLGVPVCAGQVCASEAATAAATETVVRELREHVRSQPANVDETGWWQKRQRGWLWTVVTRAVTVFTIALTRAGSVARGLVDPSAGQVITTDRYKGYLWLPLRQRQICWAHLSRDFQAMVDRANAGSQIGEELLCCAQDLFSWWYRVRDGTLKRSTFRQYIGRALRCIASAATGFGVSSSMAQPKNVPRAFPARHLPPNTPPNERGRVCRLLSEAGRIPRTGPACEGRPCCRWSVAG